MIGSYYGKPNKAIHTSNVMCHGDERSLQQCSKTEYGLKEVPASDFNVAGVSCVPDADITVASNTTSSKTDPITSTSVHVPTTIATYVLAAALIIVIVT